MVVWLGGLPRKKFSKPPPARNRPEEAPVRL